jgi:hypothetical protein
MAHGEPNSSFSGIQTNGEMIEIIAAHLEKRNGQVMLVGSRNQIVGQTTPAANLTPRTPTLRVPPGRLNIARLGGKAAKTHERVDITSLPLRDRKRRILAQLKRALDLAAESRLRTG